MKLPILVKISATVIKILNNLMNDLQKFNFTVFRSMLSHLRSMKFTGTSALTAQPAVRLSKCWVVKLPILCHPLNSPDPCLISTGRLCNMGQAAGALLPHANPWRRLPHWATRGEVVQIWSWDHQCCSYSMKADGGHFEHFLWQLMNDHTASFEITKRVVRVVTETCVFDG